MLDTPDRVCLSPEVNTDVGNVDCCFGVIVDAVSEKLGRLLFRDALCSSIRPNGL